MKENFKIFYDLSEQELSNVWADDSTIFVFDTNILLNLYQYSEETQDEFFKILNIVKDRVWIPFHVALEYQRRRLDVIRDEKGVFKKIDDKLNGIKDMAGKLSDFKLKARNPNLFNIEEKFKEDICSLVDVFKEEVEKIGKSQPCVRSNDQIRAKLDDLLEGKVGDEPKEDWVQQVITDGIVRYEKKVPPGYQDANKDRDASKSSFTHNNIEYERRFGDLIIWQQILEYLKSVDTIKNVIFITDDSKEDWWEIIDSNGKKHIGARTELKSEMYKETGVDFLKMYHTNDFLTAAKKYCGIEVNDKAIEETEDLFNDIKLKNYISQRFVDLQMYSTKTSHEDSLNGQLVNLELQNEGYENPKTIQQNLYLAIDRKESLREALLALQDQCFEVGSKRNSLRKELANLELQNKGYFPEKSQNLQKEYSQAIIKSQSLNEELDRLQQRYSRAAREKDSLEERLANLDNTYIGFSNLFKGD